MSAPDDKATGDSDVFAGLSRTRPQRPSARRQQAKKPAVKKAAAAKPATKPAARKPRAAKAAPVPPVPRSGYATPEPNGAQDGGDVVGAAVQAVAELAQLGASAGSQVLRSLLGRFPKP